MYRLWGPGPSFKGMGLRRLDLRIASSHKSVHRMSRTGLCHAMKRNDGRLRRISTFDSRLASQGIPSFLARLERRCIGKREVESDRPCMALGRGKQEHSADTTMGVTRAYDTSSYFELEGQTFECRCAILSFIRSIGQPLGTWTVGNLVRERYRCHAMPSRRTKTRQIKGTNLAEVAGVQEQSARPRGSTATELTCVNCTITIHLRVRGSVKREGIVQRSPSIPCASTEACVGQGWWKRREEAGTMRPEAPRSATWTVTGWMIELGSLTT